MAFYLSYLLLFVFILAVIILEAGLLLLFCFFVFSNMVLKQSSVFQVAGKHSVVENSFCIK